MCQSVNESYDPDLSYCHNRAFQVLITITNAYLHILKTLQSNIFNYYVVRFQADIHVYRDCQRTFKFDQLGSVILI